MSMHLREEEINAIADLRGRPVDSRETSRHLDECPECRQNVAVIAAVMTAAGELRQPIVPARDLWPSVSGRTVYTRSIRGPWLYTIIFSVLVIAGTSTWLERTRPWERVRTSVEEAVAPVASDAELASILITLRGDASDAGKRVELARMAPAVFRGRNLPLREEFFATVSTIRSDGERRALLLKLMPYSNEIAVAAAMIDAVTPMQSTSGAADVLIGLAENSAITTNELRVRYLRVADGWESKEDGRRARAALPGN